MNENGQYLLEIIRQLEDIQLEWSKVLKSVEDQAYRARKANIDIDDDEAYLRCVQLLEEEFDTEEQRFNAVRRKLKVGLQSIDQHIELCVHERGVKDKEKEILMQEITEIESRISKHQKRRKRQEQYREKIAQTLSQLQMNNNKLQSAKESSYEQKSLYMQSQQIEMDLVSQIGQIEDEERIYYQFKTRQEKYRQLSKILDKLRGRSDMGNRDVQGYLKQKISQMSMLRANLLGQNQKLMELNSRIQDQNYIIEGLKYKAQNYEQPADDNLLRQYQDKYEQLYFSKDKNLDNWKNYKLYLEELLKRNKIDQYLGSSPSVTFNNHSSSNIKEDNYRAGKSSYLRNRMRTDPTIVQIDEEPPLQSAFKGIKKSSAVTPVRREKIREKDSLKLPKLVKMSGGQGEQLRIKQNLKTDLKKMINESDISLQSVNSDDSVSGEFIEVQFHKK